MASIQPQKSPAPLHGATPKLQRLKVLVLIDGSERTSRVVEYALSLAHGDRALKVVLLGIVREPPDGRLRGYGSFKREEIHARLKDIVGQRAVSAAARRFDQQGVTHTDRIEVGDPVETILRVAGEEGSDLVLIGDSPVGPIRRWLPKAIGLSLATVANRVIQLSPVSVVVVK